jgi:hypothetical protein
LLVRFASGEHAVRNQMTEEISERFIGERLYAIARFYNDTSPSEMSASHQKQTFRTERLDAY